MKKEKLDREKGLGRPGHRWLWEADVPTELFRVLPASPEIETRVHRANRLTQKRETKFVKTDAEKCIKCLQMSPVAVWWI